ncbi:response regulator transcription factor [Saccharibacillus sp. CPCC 101409]|uniref:response regulator transcription factor n=1 Tax=Saccharibacillus sp. CPCC 101409 TaxID=3058041 RepID=UPI0026736127|nr:response regulator transcription factor [Saccharibacillus sp. CPCC 101409]MDO3410253.1 response regulator transcription factor [Saccharibacillus sp. CPCC 101409]
MGEAVLIIEDEDKIGRLLELELEYEGYRTGRAASGTEGLEIYRQGGWDLVLLDVMLPGLSGIEVLRRIRASDPRTPVILLTARDSVEDKVAGLDLGASDYVTKPFRIEELLARVRSALRVRAALESAAPEAAGEGSDETAGPAGGELSAGDLRLNERTREVFRADRRIDLTPREFDLLVFLLRNQRQVLSREQLIREVWGYDYAGDTNIVDVYIRYVRKKIGEADTPELIQTVRGVGYVLKEPS